MSVVLTARNNSSIVSIIIQHIVHATAVSSHSLRLYCSDVTWTRATCSKALTIPIVHFVLYENRNRSMKMASPYDFVALLIVHSLRLSTWSWKRNVTLQCVHGISARLVLDARTDKNPKAPKDDQICRHFFRETLRWHLRVRQIVD